MKTLVKSAPTKHWLLVFLSTISPLKLTGSAAEEGVGSARRRWRIERVQLLKGGLLFFFLFFPPSLPGRDDFSSNPSFEKKEVCRNETEEMAACKPETEAEESPCSCDVLTNRTVTREETQQRPCFFFFLI